VRRALATLLSAAVVLGPASAAAASGSHAPVPAGRAARAGRPAATALPVVSGSYGQTPTIRFPSSTPPTGLITRVLESGHGPTVQKGDLIAVAYTGQIWRGKVFDSTYLAKFGHETPFATRIGMGQVVKGWDDGLPGTRVGSRVLLVIPPRWGYGSAGAPSAGITGSDTIVFVVDVLGAWGKDVSEPGAKAVTYSRGGITVTGRLGSQPQVSIARSARQPSKASEVVLARGAGSAVTGGLVVYEEYVTNWSGKEVQSTWAQGAPTDSTVSTTSGGDPFAGARVGGRLLFEEPHSSQGGPYAIVVDILADVSSR
jgi:peptidylprolyl isomerase